MLAEIAPMSETCYSALEIVCYCYGYCYCYCYCYYYYCYYYSSKQTQRDELPCSAPCSLAAFFPSRSNC